MWLPAGIIELQTSWVVDEIVGQFIAGAGSTAAKDGPRDRGTSWSGDLGGTSLYWAGSSGGTVITVQNVRNLIFQGLDVHLAEDAGSNHAAIGIHWTNPGGAGLGECGVEHVAFVSPSHGGIGMQFGTSTGDANIDTFKLLFCEFRNLATGIKVKHLQGLGWRIFGPTFRDTDVCFDFEQGGQLFLQGVHGVHSVSGDVTVVKVGAAGANPGNYTIHGGYFERQQSASHTTIFDFASAANTCIGVASGVYLDVMSNGEFDGTKPAAFEVGNRNVVHADGCNLQSQPIVRFRTGTATDKISLVAIRGSIVQSGVALGGEAVTCNEGGYAGQVLLEGCQRDLENFSATIGILGGPGNSNTHRDEKSHSNSNIINGFDAWPSQTARV